WVILGALVLIGAGPLPAPSRSGPSHDRTAPLVVTNEPAKAGPSPAAARRLGVPATIGQGAGGLVSSDPGQVVNTAKTAALFALISLAPAAVLMVTSFVRINIVLTLLRQALGSPQVPGNQVITALALLLTALVMRPVADVAYSRGIKPYSEGRCTPAE